MARHVRKKSPEVFICTLLLSLSVIHALAWGDGGAATGEPKAVMSNYSTAGKGAVNLSKEITSAREAVRGNPANASAHVRLAYLLLQKGELDGAMHAFDEALKLNPRAYDAKTGRGIVLARKGKLRDAEQTLLDALVLNPNPVRTHYELGLVYEKLGDMQKALAQFKEGVKKHEQGR